MRALLPYRSLALALLVVAARAPAQERVWVLNSDRSIERYRLAEDAFRETWNAATVDIDLGRLTLDEAEVERRMAAFPPSAVYCIGSKSYFLAAALLKDEPIVLSSALQWRRFPARAKRWIIANEVPVESQLNLFRHVFPQITRVGVLCSETYGLPWMDAAVQTGKDHGFTIESSFVNKAADGPAALAELLGKVEALWLIPDPVILSGSDAVRAYFAAAHAARKPVFAYTSAYAAMGAALAVEPDDATSGRQAAQLLRPIAAGDLPTPFLQSPAGTAITLNMRIVVEYNLKLNEAALDGINHIIR